MRKIVFEIVQVVIAYVIATVYGYYNTSEPGNKYSWLISAIMVVTIYPIIKLASRKKQRRDSYMSWNEFIERYFINHEEFRFRYKNYTIHLFNSRGGTKYAYCICEHIEDEGVFGKIKNKSKHLKSDEFDSPQELLEKFSIDNYSFNEIWNELERK